MQYDKVSAFVKLLRKNINKKLIIWGAGYNGKNLFKFCKTLSFDVSYFVDKSYTGKEDLLFSTKIQSPNCLLQEEKDNIFVLVASTYYIEIKETLEEWGFREHIDFIDTLTLNTAVAYDYDDCAHEYIMNKFIEGESLFKAIEIETINRCNNTCEFCPVNTTNEKREFGLMTDEMFNSIIEQLRELNYCGFVSLFSNNEPFLDKRIESFVKITRDSLPKCYLSFFTNGTLLSMDRFLDIIDDIDLLIIDNYSNDYEFVPYVKQIYEYCLDNENVAKKIQIIKRRKNQVLSSRGGQAPNKRIKNGFNNVTCLLPFQQMIVRPDGKISLCCNDAYGNYTLGDLNQESVEDAWFNKNYKKIRESLIEGRKNIDMCSKCDTLIGETTDVYMPAYTKGNLLTVW